MTSNRHFAQTIAEGLHSIVAFEFANSTARLAAVGFQSYDLYKIAIQLSDNSLWILTSVNPIVWSSVQSNDLSVGGDLDGYLPDPHVVDLHIPGQAAGNLLYNNGTHWVPIPLGNDGYFLQANTASTKPNWVQLPIATNVLTNINVSAGSTSQNLSALTLSNGGGVSFGLNNGVITATVVPGAAAGIGGVSAGTQSQTSGTLVFSNSNNVSFGMNNNSVITGSASFPVQTNQTQGVYALGNTTGQSSSSTVDARSVSISGAGNISVGYSNGIAIISQTGAGQVNFSAGTTSNNLSNIIFSNANGVGFGLNGSTLTASYTVPTQTNQSLGLYGVGNTTQNSSTTLDARTISFDGLGAATVGFSNGSVQISVPVQSSLSFQNGNNITFGLNGSTLTASVPSQSAQTQSNVQALFDGANSVSTGTVRFSNSNGVSFGINGQTITASHNGITSQTVQTQSIIQGLYDGANSISTGTARFSNANGISFGINGQTITASHNAITSQTNQTEGLYAVGNTIGQSSSTTVDARSLSLNLSGGISGGYSNGSLVLSVNTAGGGALTNLNLSAGTTSQNLSNFVLSNSNGVSFGLNGSTITGSVAAQTNQTVGGYAVGNTTGQSSSSTFDARSLSFKGNGGASVGYSNGSIIIDVNTAGGGALTNINISAGTTSNNLSAINFNNANNVSFGLNGSTITGSASFPAQTNQTVGLYALGNTTQNSSTTLDARTLSFNGLGAATVGYSNGSIQISVPVQSAQTQSLIQAIYDGAASITTGTIRFSNSNGLSFGINGQTITASHNGITSQTNQSVGLYGLGNTTQNSSTTLDARSLSFNGLGNLTVGYSNGSIQLSGSQSAQTQSVVVPSAGTQTATSGIVVFSNSNNVSFGMSGSTRITASVNAISNINLSAGTTSNNNSAFTFADGNGVSFGLNAGTITASVIPGGGGTLSFFGLGNTTQNSSTTLDARSLSLNGLGIITVGYSNGSVQLSATTAAQTNQTLGKYAVGNTTGQSSSSTFDARTMSFNGAGMISVGYSNSSLMISATQSNQTEGLYAVGNTIGQSSSTTIDARSLTFNLSGGISGGYSNGSLVLSVNTAGGGALTNMNISAGTTSNNLSAITFNNANGVSFGLNASTITASVSQSNQSIGLYGVGNTTQNSSTTLDARSLSFNGLGNITVGYSNGSVQLSGSQTNQTLGLYAADNTVGQSSSSTFDARSLTFDGRGIASVGYSNGSVIISVPSAGGSVNFSAGTTSNNLNAITFSNSNGVSFGLNGSTMTGSVVAQTNQTVGMYALGNTTQNSSTTLDARTLSFNGLGAATVGYSNGSIQVSVPVQTAQTQSNIQGLFDGANSISTGTARFSNSNGISFGINGQTITASHNGITSQTAQTGGFYALGNTTQNSSTTLDVRTLSFNGLGGMTVGYSNGSIQLSAPTTANLISRINVSAGTTSNNLSALTFADGNGLAFGLNGSTITGSYTVPTQSNQSVGLYALGNTTQNSSTTLDARSLSFNGLGAATVGYSNGSIQMSVPTISSLSVSGNLSMVVNANTISLGVADQTMGIYASSNTVGQSSSSTIDARSVSFIGKGIASVGLSAGQIVISVPSAGGSVNFSAGTTSNNLNAITFSNSNGVSFGLNGSTITGSIATQTNQTVGLYALGNTTQNSSTTLDARTLSFNGLGIITAGYSNGSIQISATTAAQTNQTIGGYAVGNTTGQSSSSTFDARTLSFNGAGIISLGYSGGSVMVSATQSAQTQNIVVPSAGTQTATSGTVVWSNSNNMTFGMSGSSRITVSYNFNVSGGTTSNNLNAITFADGNGVSFGLNASTLTASINQSAQTLGLFALGNTTQNSSTTRDARSLSFNGLGIITVGYSNGSVQLSATQSAQTQSLIQAIYDGANSITTGTIRFSNSNGISFGINGQTITASHNGITSQTNQSMGLYAIGNTTGQSSSTTIDARSLTFSGSGNITVGYSGGTVIIAQTGGGGQSNQSLGLYAVGNTTQNSSTTLDARTLSFNGIGGATVGYSNGSVQVSVPASSSLSVSGNLSLAVNANTISLGVAPQVVSQMVYPANPWHTQFSIGNASLSLQHFNAFANISATQANFLMALTGNTNSSGALTISMGLFSMSGSTMSLASSASRQISWTSGSQTTTATVYGGISGTRYRTIALGTWNISAGDYMLGLWYRTTNNGTWSAFGQQGPTIVGAVDGNETNAYLHGYSTSSFTTGMIGSVNITDTNYVRTGSPALQHPGFILIGSN